jgi:hypothetical protein
VTNTEGTMDRRDYYHDVKWCAHCATYVRYLMSVNHSYCITCGSVVRLFSDEDAQRFAVKLEHKKQRAS